MKLAHQASLTSMAWQASFIV